MKRRTVLRSGAAALALWLAPVGSARADGFYWSFQYSPALPVGSVRKFVPDATPLGFALGARVWFGQRFSVGVDGSYTRLYRTLPRGTYPLDDGAITATIYSSVDVLAAVPQAHLYFGPMGDVIPYLGLGAGLSWVTFRVRASDLDFSNMMRGFVVAPEGGILIPVDRQDGLLLQSLSLGVRYTFSSAGFRDVADTSFVSAQIGALVY